MRILVEVQRSRNYPIVVGLLAAVSASTGLTPLGQFWRWLLLSHPRWQEIYLASCLGTALGVLVFAGTVELYGLPVVESMFPGIEQRTDWLRYTHWVSRYGWIALVTFAAMSVPQMPALSSFCPKPHQPRQNRRCDFYWKANQVRNIWDHGTHGVEEYALSKVWLASPHSPELGLTLVLLGLVMTFSPLILWQMAKQSWHGATIISSWVAYTWMGFLFLFCSIALAFDFGHALVALLGFKWHLSEAMAFRTVGLLALLMLGYGFVEASHIRVEEITITTPKPPPAIDRVTIAQISDLHLGVMQGDEFLERVIVKLRELQPDIVVATGDIVDGQGNDLDELAKHFLTLKPSKGAFAIIGNHEYYAGLENSLRFLHSTGFTVLRGESAAAGGIILVGVDDPSVGGLGQGISVDTRKALVSVQNGAFIVLLKHQPVVDRDIPFDLQLSGHIHGGQIFPFGFLTWLTYGVHTGLTQLADGRRLYVSRGAGTWGPPIRIFAEPEITLIKIENK